jgi:hypothetical protein
MRARTTAGPNFYDSVLPKEVASDSPNLAAISYHYYNSSEGDVDSNIELNRLRYSTNGIIFRLAAWPPHPWLVKRGIFRPAIWLH